MAALTLVTGLRSIFTPDANLCSACDPHPCTAILTGGGKVLCLLSTREAEALSQSINLTRLDATGLIAVPGFLDCHVHVCGGGGEAGPASRTPEAKLSELLRGGITTVVGLTGTDSVTRSQVGAGLHATALHAAHPEPAVRPRAAAQENLIAKTRALNADGITALHWCGSYSLPPATVTGSVEKDICLIESCVGVGEVAVSDHRGSAPSPLDLARLALEARRGGMLSGKAGLTHVHMGGGAAGLAPLRDALAAAKGVLPIRAFHPTHMARTEQLVVDGAAWLAAGGTLDLTCDAHLRRRARCVGTVARGGPWTASLFPAMRTAACLCLMTMAGWCGMTWRTQVSCSPSRWLKVAAGQAVVWHHTQCLPISPSPNTCAGALLRFLEAMYMGRGWPLEAVLPFMTRNPARLLGLASKGTIAVGAGADILLLDARVWLCAAAAGETPCSHQAPVPTLPHAGAHAGPAPCAVGRGGTPATSGCVLPPLSSRSTAIPAPMPTLPAPPPLAHPARRCTRWTCTTCWRGGRW